MEMRLQSITQRHKSTGWRMESRTHTGVGGGLTYSPTKNEEKKAQKVKKNTLILLSFHFSQDSSLLVTHIHSTVCHQAEELENTNRTKL